jgi:Tfp pilus assembly protein PilO
MSSSNRLIVSILAIAALAIVFWIALLGPKREQADELAGQVDSLHVSLSEAQSQLAAARSAKRDFPVDYRQLVVLGPAVPAGDETSSLLVELNHVAHHARVKFDSILLNGTGETSTVAPVPVAPAPAPAPSAPSAASPSGAVPAAATIPPTEAAASVLPLGAAVGPAGLAVMPYNLSFSGSFFHVADFIAGIDSLVHAGARTVGVDGRLVTLDGFSLSADPTLGFPHLDANFAVTTYLTPPSQGLTAGATPTEPAPAPATATPATEAAPAEAPAAPSETVSAR